MNVDTSVLDIERQNDSDEDLSAGVGAPHQSFFRKWGGLIILSLALAIIIIDTTLLNVSLRTIISDLHTDLRSMQWVITIYSLILAAFTITGGRLGDLFGRKRMFLVGAIIFAVGSFLASISTNVGMMIAGEAIIEGLGAALMMPATASLLVTNFKGRDRSIAFGVWGGIAAASSAIGPILGGWLTTSYSWRWGFRINIVVVALVLLGAFLIREDHSLRRKSKLDVMGIVLSSLGMLSVVFGFIQASTYGWFKAKEQLVLFGQTINLGSLSATPVFILLGLVILGIFLWHERRRESKGLTPLLSLGLFKNRTFVAGASTMGVLALGQAGLFFTIPVFLQAVRNLDALHTGLTLLPMSISLLIAAPFSAFLVKYISPKRLIQSGLVLSIVAFIVLYFTLSVDSTAWTLAPGFVIFGLGMGLIMAQASNLTLSAVSVEESGEASGVNNTLRMVGQTLGSAILGAVLLSALTANVTTHLNESRIIPAQVKQGLEAGLSSHISDISFGDTGSQTGNLPPQVGAEITKITNQSIVEANKTVMLYGLVFVFLGLLVSRFLPNGRQVINASETDSVMEESGTAEAVAAAASVAAAEESAPKNLKATNWQLYAGSILAMLILAGIVYVATAPKETSEDSSRVAIVPTEIQDGGVTGASNQTEVGQDQTEVGQDQTEANQDQAGQTQTESDGQVAGTTDQTAPTTGVDEASIAENYLNGTIGFAFVKPTDWSVVKDSGREVVFKSGSALYNVQSYETPSDSLADLVGFLRSQSNIHNVVPAQFAGLQAYQFTIDGLYSSGYAFLDSGKLYYVLGSGSERTSLADMHVY